MHLLIIGAAGMIGRKLAEKVAATGRIGDPLNPHANGRLILARSVPDAMGLTGDTKVHLTMEGDVVRLEPLGHRVRRARELYRAAVKTPRTTEDFLRDRRAEVEADEVAVMPSEADGDEGRAEEPAGDRTGGAA